MLVDEIKHTMEKSFYTVVKKTTDVLKSISVEPYLFLTTLGVYLTMVPFQSLLMNRACRNTLGYPYDICDDIDHHKMEQEKSIEIGNNLFTGVILSASLPAVVVVVFVGPWSDKYSRKWPLLMGATGMFVESIALALLTFYQSVPPIWYIPACLLSGTMGGFLVCVSASSSYLSDVTDEKSRSTRFAILECFYVCATVFGNVLGGQIFQAFGYLVVFCAGPVLYFLSILYVLFVVKETRPTISKERRGEVFRDLFSLENIKESYHTCTRKRHGNIRLQIWLLIFLDTSVKFVVLGTLGIGFAYAKQMYKMGVAEFSNVSTIFSIINALTTVVVVPLLTKKLMLHEAAVGFIGMLSLMSKMVLSAVATTLPIFYFALVSGTLFNCVLIAVQSRLSKLVGKEELGRAFSLLGMFSAFAPILGTLAFFQVYNVSLNFFPGLTYAAASVFLLPCVIVFGWMMKLPTISVGEFAREDDLIPDVPLGDVSSKYKKLQEVKG